MGNSTQKGDLFEAQVFLFVRSEVESGRTWINPATAQFFQKRPYYSRDREKDIVFDIVVEAHAKAGLSFRWFIECKDTGRPVAIDDIEEFAKKVDQISSANYSSKATVFSTSGFTATALTFAKNKGLSLARMSAGGADWILPRVAVKATVNPLDTTRQLAMTDDAHHASIGRVYGVAGERFGIELGGLLRGIAQDLAQFDTSALHTEVPAAPLASVPFKSPQQIELRARQAVDLLRRLGLRADADLQHICEALAGHGVEFVFDADLGFDRTGRRVLGRTAFLPPRLYVTNTLDRDSPRWRFTLAHELGHLALHRTLARRAAPLVHFQMERDFLGRVSGPVDRLEWQANCFAACLLMPRDRVDALVSEHMTRHDLRKRASWSIFVDHQPCNFAPYRELLKRFTAEFGVSQEAAELRLTALGLVEDRRSGPKRVGDLLGAR